MKIRFALVASPFFAAACCLLVSVTADAQEAAPKNEVLQRFVGVWEIKSTLKPAKWHPDGGEFTGKESTVWALKNRIIMIRDVSQPDGKKGLFIATYDREKDAYPFWGFDSKGLLGGEWLLKWNAEARAAVGRATDLPPAWTSGGKNHFPDADTNNVSYWMRDENGELLLDGVGRKDRLSAEREEAIVAEWKKQEPADDLPKELSVLDRMIGTWEMVSVRKPAIFTPNGDRTTGTITREWILDGRFVMGTSVNSDESEGISLFSFDLGKKEYRNWFFNSLGHRYDAHGNFNAAQQTFSLTAARDDGKTTTTSIRFDGPDREVWRTLITDAAGKVYVDMDSTVTRKK
jgi:hypothetical protein